MLQLLVNGIVASLRDIELRSMMLYMGLIQLLIGGPLQVGLPVFAENRLDGSAAAFGTLMAANGIGTLVGVILAGMGKAPRWSSIGWMLLSIDFAFGIAIAVFGFVTTTLWGSVLMVGFGVFGGMVQVKTFSWLQGRTPPEQMGRVMSLFMFIVMGVAPLSASVGGWLLRQMDITTFYIACGVVLSLAAAVSMTFPAVRRIGPAENTAP